MDKIQQTLLEQIADLHGVPEGAYNIRSDGATAARATTANIDIVTKTDKAGIDIFIKPGTKNESMHIPVIIAKTGLKEVVYNDFYIGEDCDVTIVAGCGISNCGDQDSQHDGIHSFHVGKNSKVKYVERHYAEGDGRGERIMNPVTIIELDEGAYMEMDTTQIKGVDSTKRLTEAKLGDGATLIVHEKLMTHGTQYAETEFKVELDGEGCRHGRGEPEAVARDESKPAVRVAYKRQRQVQRPLGVRRDHHGQRLSARGAGDNGEQRRGEPDPRSGDRQDSGRAADKADDPGPDRRRGRRTNCCRFFKISA